MTRKQIVLCIVGVLAIVSLFFDAGQTVFFGWVGYLLRVLPQVNPDPKTVAVGIAAIIAFAIGVHWLGQAFANRKTDGPRWTIRGTMAATVLVFVMFTSAVAIVGVVHMSLWLATSPEPMLAPSVKSRFAGRMTSANNLKQFGLGFHNHYDAYGAVACGRNILRRRPRTSWMGVTTRAIYWLVLPGGRYEAALGRSKKCQVLSWHDKRVY